MAYYERPKWFAQAACRKHPGVEFVPRGQPSPKTTYREQREICAGCPVKALCLDEALALGPECVGIWGGTDGRERRAMLREREAA
ncbi:MAG: WhiB family transcriptional regulator [Acidimicrobiia bacterium]